MIHSQDNLYWTYSRILVIFVVLHGSVTWICQYFIIDDNSYIRQELKPFHIIVQDINDEECTYYKAPVELRTVQTYTELITSNTFKSSLTGKTYHTKTFEPLS